MNFALEISGAVTTGSVSPEIMGQFNSMFGGMLGILFG